MLQWLKVIKCADGIAGPFCGKLLAGLGAQVIKVERAEAGDVSRSMGPYPKGVPNAEASGLFLYLNTGKRGSKYCLIGDTASCITKFKEFVQAGARYFTVA